MRKAMEVVPIPANAQNGTKKETELQKIIVDNYEMAVFQVPMKESRAGFIFI